MQLKDNRPIEQKGAISLMPTASVERKGNKLLIVRNQRRRTRKGQGKEEGEEQKENQEEEQEEDQEEQEQE